MQDPNSRKIIKGINVFSGGKLKIILSIIKKYLVKQKTESKKT